MSEHEGSDAKFWIGFFIGGILGAIVLFFLGTKEGKKTGKRIEEKGRELLDDVTDKLGELEEKGKELLEKGQEIKEHVVEHLGEKKEELTHAASEKFDSALAQLEDLQKQGIETTANLRKRFFKNLPNKH